MERCTTEWALRRWAVMAQSSLKSEVSVRTEAPEWAARQPVWERYSTKTKKTAFEGAEPRHNIYLAEFTQEFAHCWNASGSHIQLMAIL